MDLSILLVQYRPDEGELRRTLASLLRQSCRDFELVVADDGSDEDFFPLTRKILAENGFTGAKFVKLTPNGGTVKNVLNGAKQAAGKWVFTVSPGDYLYDADTVVWLLEVLRRDAPRVAFGRLACYADRDGAPIQRPGHENDHRVFRKLRGLHAQPEDIQPPPRAVDAHADSRNNHQNQRQSACRQ